MFIRQTPHAIGKKGGQVVKGVCRNFNVAGSNTTFCILFLIKFFAKLSGQIAHFGEFWGANNHFLIKGNTTTNVLRQVPYMCSSVLYLKIGLENHTFIK